MLNPKQTFKQSSCRITVEQFCLLLGGRGFFSLFNFGGLICSDGASTGYISLVSITATFTYQINKDKHRYAND